ncbi:hypothetical protein LguiA_026638 [Lonicera macranthoides]
MGVKEDIVEDGRTVRVRVLRMPLALLEFVPNSTHDISSNPSPELKKFDKGYENGLFKSSR